MKVRTRTKRQERDNERKQLVEADKTKINSMSFELSCINQVHVLGQLSATVCRHLAQET